MKYHYDELYKFYCATYVKCQFGATAEHLHEDHALAAALAVRDFRKDSGALCSKEEFCRCIDSYDSLES